MAPLVRRQAQRSHENVMGGWIPWRVPSVDNMPAGNQRNLLITVALILVSIFLPLVGHVVLTVMIVNDAMTRTEKLIWLIVVWTLWWIGPTIYLLVGQRRNRLFGGHALL